MAKPYLETKGRGWSYRLRLKGHEIYRTGFGSEAQAQEDMKKERLIIESAGKAALDGPWKTTVAQALLDYGVARLPEMKGAEQEARRINAYLKQLSMPTLCVIKITDEHGRASLGPKYFKVELEAPLVAAKIPKGLGAHRQAQAAKTKNTQRQRQILAATRMADVVPYQIQTLVNTMVQDGYGAATVALERALLRQLFKYARNTWSWNTPASNPARGLYLPKVDNTRDRVLTNDEWELLSEVLEDSRNPHAAPAIAMLLETAVRSGEVLLEATWGDLDTTRCILHLRAAKAGKREVPLGPGAMQILLELQSRLPQPIDALGRILPITYESLKAIWKRACERAGIDEIRLHDLRHTSATRYALEFHGNMPVLKLITGHKTDKMVLRYVNIKTDHVVSKMHGRPLNEGSMPARLRLKGVANQQSQRSEAPRHDEPLPDNVVRFVRAQTTTKIAAVR